MSFKSMFILNELYLSKKEAITRESVMASFFTAISYSEIKIHKKHLYEENTKYLVLKRFRISKKIRLQPFY